VVVTSATQFVFEDVVDTHFFIQEAGGLWVRVHPEAVRYRHFGAGCGIYARMGHMIINEFRRVCFRLLLLETAKVRVVENG